MNNTRRKSLKTEQNHKKNPILIFGHKNPDTDSVMSAIALSYLKNRVEKNTKPVVLGPVSRETMFALSYFDLKEPEIIDNVKARLCDIVYDSVPGISEYETILSVYEKMEHQNYQTLPVIGKRPSETDVDIGKEKRENSETFEGIVTMKDIAMGLIKSSGKLNTTLENIKNSLKGDILYSGKGGKDRTVLGNPKIAAFELEKFLHDLCSSDIVVVGNRPDVIAKSIESKVELIIISGEYGDKIQISEQIIKNAEKMDVPILAVPKKTYEISRLLPQCNMISSIMKSDDIIKFNHTETLDDVHEEIVSKSYRNFPVVDEKGHFLGFVGKRHLIHPAKKRVILVDHNEYGQSAEGLKNAEIVEIVDHHKIGDISTSVPITFRNMPVGSTCTIIYRMCKEQNEKQNEKESSNIPEKIAGALLSGILSDTLLFKSPTTTETDKEAALELSNFLGFTEENMKTFALDMFKAGTSLEECSIEEIVHTDFKEIKTGDCISGIGQVLTFDTEKLFERKKFILNYLSDCRKQKGYDLAMLIITDIIKEGSYVLYSTENEHLIEKTFHKTPSQGMFSEGLLSRKKQLVPWLSAAFEELKKHEKQT